MKHISILIMGVIVPFNVYAGPCTPTPDCASIGYTETSCEGDSLKCPFDITKLYCIPCDSSFRYDCSGDNITGGTGSACGGKYVSCECVAGSVFNNGQCICDYNCVIGNFVYSDKTCSSCINSSKNMLGVLVSENGDILSKDYRWMLWSSDTQDIAELISPTVLVEDINGRNNTDIIVNHYGENVDISKNAAVYCYNYFPVNVENSKNSWYLPSTGELHKYLVSNFDKLDIAYKKLGIELSTSSNYGYFWSSAELNYDRAWMVSAISGDIHARWTKYSAGGVLCMMNINE